MNSILIIDDEESICWGVAQIAGDLGHQSASVASAEEGLAWLAEHHADLVVLDVRLPGMSGLEAIEKIRETAPHIAIVVITAFGDLETATAAMKGGVSDYLLKPFDRLAIERSLQRVLDAQQDSSAGPPPADDGDGIIGMSAAMQEVFRQIALVSQTDAFVLIGGESGTGKEMVAKAIHVHSPRAQRAFVGVNVASLSPSLAESELFGHTEGAFTGAAGSRRGLLAVADGGTLFLDEVAEIPLSLQVKLLRAMESGEFYPVGSETLQRSDFRLIAATNKDLWAEVKADRFRQDLLYRISSYEIKLPPLRDRGGDCEHLARYFLRRFADQAVAPAPDLSSATIAELERRRWEGNVRELRNAMEHAWISARGRCIEPDHLPREQSAQITDEVPADSIASLQQATSAWAREQLEQQQTDLMAELQRVVEPPLIQAALRAGGGQFIRAAQYLGMHRVTLAKKAKEFKIDEQPPNG